MHLSVGQGSEEEFTFRFHDDRNKHHGHAHSDSTDNHGDSSTPCIHVVHIRQSEDVQNDTLDPIGKEGRRGIAQPCLLEEKYGVVHDAYTALVLVLQSLKGREGLTR